jgi:hypothetical protein
LNIFDITIGWLWDNHSAWMVLPLTVFGIAIQIGLLCR